MFDDDDRPYTRLYKKTQKYISAKFKVENELLPKKGHMTFFPPQSTTVRDLPNIFVGEICDELFQGN